ncbi:alpha/beta hydrolase [Aquabacterium sp. UBA2148]|uniref:alpha/beta hydrolase n=1 Tax=Aquabacterium sp. UBA2148 TaxID=1946042 RepID=UPI00257C2981|nr:alpha/beta hydrolase [Aquabacterium sp. UBA2148]
MTRHLVAAAAALLSAPMLALAQAPVGAAAAPVVTAAAVGTVQPLTFACQQVTCDGELWLPSARADGKKPPVIVMAHGFGGLRDWGLGPFAERFVKAGFAVLRFDYRGFGKSGGQPRRVVDGKEHVKDWLSALDAVAKRSDIDPQRIGVWGTSYSGGQVLVVGAERPQQVKAVSAQVPFVSGLSSGLQFPLKYQPLATWYALRDLMRGDDEEPVYVPTIAPNAFSALVCAECNEGYNKLVPAGQEDQNKVAARVFLSLPFWFPGDSAPKVQAPALVIAAAKDGLIPVAKVRDVAKSLPKGEYLELPDADHFSPYSGPAFEQVVSRQTAFFVKHLKP